MKLNLYKTGSIIGIFFAFVAPAIGAVIFFIIGNNLLGIIFSATVLLSIPMYFIFIKPQRSYSRIMKTGRKATATIISTHATNVMENRQPVIKFEVEVKLSGVSDYKTTVKSVIPYAQLSQFQKGAKVPVMVDAADNMKVVFIGEWS